MKHRVRVQVPVERRGLFGRRKIVYEERTIVVDGRTYRRMQVFIPQQKYIRSSMISWMKWRSWMRYLMTDCAVVLFNRCRIWYNADKAIMPKGRCE